MAQNIGAKSLEQLARDFLDRHHIIDDAQGLSAGDVVALANLIGAAKQVLNAAEQANLIGLEWSRRIIRKATEEESGPSSD